MSNDLYLHHAAILADEMGLGKTIQVYGMHCFSSSFIKWLIFEEFQNVMVFLCDRQLHI